MRALGAGFLVLLLNCASLEADEGGRSPERAGPADGEARALAARIDAHLDARWAAAKLVPASVADDGEFLRRASLDLVGKIPTAAEARDFLMDPDPGKRAALVDRLLESPAYAERTVLLWRQLLLPDGDGQVAVASGGIDNWLRKKVRENAGYDRIVREIVSVKLGREVNDMLAAASSEPSPAAFFATRGGKPETLASDSARLFLGIRVECAQCHNHPFAKWKREEFWGFAAFFAGVPQQPDDGTAAMRRTREDSELRELTIPGTSKVIKATHLDHSAPVWRPRAGTRDILADWITAPDNPYFARAAVNRTWARLFGNGLVDPVDDLDADGDPALVALLNDIAAQFRDHSYDMKYLMRALMATRAYNLSSAAESQASTSGMLFSRMPVRGLSPAQFVDSLAQATGTDLGATRAQFLELFTERDVPPTESQTSILQALTLMNGTFVGQATKPDTGDVIGAIAEAPYLSDAERVEQVFLATLSRRPRAHETELVMRYLDRHDTPGDRTKALSDVFWALLNGPEFRTNH